MKLWTFMFGVFQRRAGARLNITLEADHLITRDGEGAYRVAREFSRTLREAGKADLSKYWANVAVNIANKQGKVIGEKVADRYEKYGRGK